MCLSVVPVTTRCVTSNIDHHVHEEGEPVAVHVTSCDQPSEATLRQKSIRRHRNDSHGSSAHPKVEQS